MKLFVQVRVLRHAFTT